MAKKAGPSKRLTADNLAKLGTERLADLLLEMADEDANWKRRLRMELAAEVGGGDLAAELDKRLVSLAGSRARISWRKRPELIRDLNTQRRLIVDRLGALDPAAAFVRLLAWFRLYPGLSGRVKDPKGELATVFEDAAQDLILLARGASANGADPVPSLAEAISERPETWGRWLRASGEALDAELAQRLLGAVRPAGPVTPVRLRGAVRRLADAAGDVDAWLSVLTDAERQSPEVTAEAVARLLGAGRLEDARRRLEAARPKTPSARLSGFNRATTPPSPAFSAAEIAVLEAEGRTEEAQAGRWTLFERTLSAAALRDYVARLPDFEDVEALDRAFARAAGWPDFEVGLAFLMDWPALREAAAMIDARPAEAARVRGDLEDWTGRLEQRFPEAAARLKR
jgi:hypothetical protein